MTDYTSYEDCAKPLVAKAEDFGTARDVRDYLAANGGRATLTSITTDVRASRSSVLRFVAEHPTVRAWFRRVEIDGCAGLELTVVGHRALLDDEWRQHPDPESVDGGQTEVTQFAGN